MFDWLGRFMVVGALGACFVWLADKVFYAFVFGLLSGELWARVLLTIGEITVFSALYAGAMALVDRWREVMKNAQIERDKGAGI